MPRCLAARVLFYVLLCASVLLPVRPVCAADFSAASGPARIIYTADTLGYIRPCQTCGGHSQGGLARRAALLPQLAAGHTRPLILAGPNEFYADRAASSPETADRVSPALYAAFRAMPYTAIAISAATARDMATRGLESFPNGVAISNSPITEHFRLGPMTAACVFLPAGARKDGSPSPDQLLAAQHAAREAAASANLVMAVSPWGIRAENALASSFAGYFHIVLGGGPGIAVPGQATGSAAAPGPLWIRSDRRGRAVNVVDIFSVPAPGAAWLDGIHFSSQLVFLDPHLPQDESTLALLQGLEDVE